MEHLSVVQQDAVGQLQTVLGPQQYDAEVLISVLQSVDWNIDVRCLILHPKSSS